MGFKVEFNSIVRVDVPENIKIGEEYSFENEGSRVYFDDIPIWLVKKDWTAVGEIKITEQERKDGKIKGRYKVYISILLKSLNQLPKCLNGCTVGNKKPN